MTMLKTRRSKSIFIGIVLVLAIVLPFIAPTNIISYVIPALFWAIGCMSWNAIARVGQFSMGQGAFYAIGGYVSAMLSAPASFAYGGTVTLVFQWPVFVGVLCGGIVAAIVALVVGSITLRIGGLFFCIVTLAFGELLRIIALNWPAAFGGANGITINAPAIGNWILGSKPAFYFLALGAVILTAVVMSRIDRSRLGRTFRAIAANDTLAAHAGIRLMKYRVIVFTVGGFFCGIAGALFAHYLRAITPTMFGFTESILILLMCAVGGYYSAVAGPIIGALLLSPLGDYLTAILQGGKPFIYGVVVLLVAFFLVNGLVDIPNLVRGAIVRRRKSAVTG